MRHRKSPFFIAFPVLLLLSCSEFQPEDWDSVFGGLHLSSSSEALRGSSDAISSNDTPGSSSAFSSSSVNAPGLSSATEISSSSVVPKSSSSSSTAASSSSDVAPGSSSSVPVSSSSSQPVQSSSSSVLSSSSSDIDCSQIGDLQTAMEDMGEDFPKISCSDNRDQNNPQTYDIVKIGTQIWMAENLNYISPKGDSWCYDNENNNCDAYGRLYDWATAMNLPASCNGVDCSDQFQEKHRGICPEGWHLPSHAEWVTLLNFDDNGTAGLKLKAKSPAWNGRDEYGFNALPGGRRVSGDYFVNLAAEGHWWSTLEGGGSQAYHMNMDNTNTRVYDSQSSKVFGYSVRCVKDN